MPVPWPAVTTLAPRFGPCRASEEVRGPDRTAVKPCNPWQPDPAYGARAQAAGRARGPGCGAGPGAQAVRAGGRGAGGRGRGRALARLQAGPAAARARAVRGGRALSPRPVQEPSAPGLVSTRGLDPLGPRVSVSDRTDLIRQTVESDSGREEPEGPVPAHREGRLLRRARDTEGPAEDGRRGRARGAQGRVREAPRPDRAAGQAPRSSVPAPGREGRGRAVRGDPGHP